MTDITASARANCATLIGSGDQFLQHCVPFGRGGQRADHREADPGDHVARPLGAQSLQWG